MNVFSKLQIDFTNIYFHLTFSILGEWPDEYTFSMNVVEDFIKREAKSEPVCIVRPSLCKYSTSTRYVISVS